MFFSPNMVWFKPQIVSLRHGRCQEVLIASQGRVQPGGKAAHKQARGGGGVEPPPGRTASTDRLRRLEDHKLYSRSP